MTGRSIGQSNWLDLKLYCTIIKQSLSVHNRHVLSTPAPQRNRCLDVGWCDRFREFLRIPPNAGMSFLPNLPCLRLEVVNEARLFGRYVIFILPIRGRTGYLLNEFMRLTKKKPPKFPRLNCNVYFMQCLFHVQYGAPNYTKRQIKYLLKQRRNSRRKPI